MQNHKTNLVVVVSGLAMGFGAAVVAAPGLAQTAEALSAQAGPPTTEADAATADDIVVTARRTSERLQDVPQTITALSDETLKKYNILQFEDVNKLVPGLNIDRGGSGFTATASLRGVTIDSISGATPTVGTFYNEVPISSNYAFLSLFDVGQIEVLRGPQGTQRAAAAPSGAITYTSRQPDLGEIGGYAEATATTRDAYNVQGAVNIPIITDKLALRVAGVFDRTQANQIRSVNSDLKPYVRTENLRASLRFRPVDTLDIQLTYTDLNSRNRIFDQLEGPGYQNPGDPLLPPTGFNGPPLTASQRASAAAFPTAQGRNNAEIYQARVAYDIGSRTRLSYNGAYSSFKTSAVQNADAYNIAQGVRVENALISPAKSYFQEVRLDRNDPTAFWSYGVGGFFTRDTNSTAYDYRSPLGGFYGQPGLPLNVFQPDPRYLATTRLNIGGPQETAGAFANSILRFLDSELYLGVRYQHRKTSYVAAGSTNGFNALGFAPPPGLSCEVLGSVVSQPFVTNPSNGNCDFAIINAPPFAPNPISQRKSYDPVIYNASFTHHFDRDLTAYASVASSWRDALPNVGLRTLEPKVSALLFPRPEKSTAFEVGLKSAWFDRKLKVNVSLFQQTFKDHLYYSPIVPYLDNNGQRSYSRLLYNAPARVRGVDFDMNWQPTTNWSVAGTFSYAKGTLRNATVPCDPLGGTATAADLVAVGGIFLCSGSNVSVSRLPRWSASLQSEYVAPLGPVEGYVRGSVAYKPDNPYAGSDLNFEAASYALIDLFAGVRDDDQNWEIGAFVKNLLDKDTLLTRDNFAFAAGTDLNTGYRNVNSLTPREFGLTARYRFGSR